ncbi:MAG TPA: carbonic anhydrase [Tepidisphaeraceae bacterium]|jgi:carbonic anhydrase
MKFVSLVATLLICGWVGGCAAESKAPAAAPAPAAVNPGEPAAAAPAVAPTADQAFEWLKAGNARFVSGHPIHPHDNTGRRVELTASQHPYAIVLGCSDSRVPPPLVFDAGLGDLFEIRVAGNTADDSALASIEYAAEHLHAPLLVVLGHEKCGAVAATVDAAKSSEKPAGHLSAIIDPIRPAVEKAKGEEGDLTTNAVKENVKNVVRVLEHSEPVLAEMVHSGHLKVVGAVYRLDTGEVVFTEAN